MNEKCSDEKLVLLATTIALELVKGKSNDEVLDLKILVGHIYSTISAYHSAYLRHKL